MKGLISLLLVLVTGCSNHNRLVQLFGSDHNLDVVKSPDRSEAFRIHAPEVKTHEFNRWPILVGPKVVQGEKLTKLSEELLDERTYCMWDEGKGCGLNPGVMLRFSRGSKSVDLVFCFECDMLLTFDGAKHLYTANFDYSHNSLLGHFMNLFPADPDLPKLIRK